MTSHLSDGYLLERGQRRGCRHVARLRRWVEGANGHRNDEHDDAGSCQDTSLQCPRSAHVIFRHDLLDGNDSNDPNDPNDPNDSND